MKVAEKGVSWWPWKWFPKKWGWNRLWYGEQTFTGGHLWGAASMWSKESALLGLKSWRTQRVRKPHDCRGLHVTSERLPLGRCFIFFKDVFIIYLRVWVCRLHASMCLASTEAREDTRSPGARVIDSCKVPCGCGKLNRSLLQEQSVFVTAETFLQSRSCFFFFFS